jgi:glycosyltransferase involved in cell wall biosynthesis
MNTDYLTTKSPLNVAFHRHFTGFTGGHLKVFDYFNHVCSSPGYHPAIYFTPGSNLGVDNPWSTLPVYHQMTWEPEKTDMLFLAGNDWESLSPAFRQKGTVPVINLIQGFRHAHPEHQLYAFLNHPAIRIFVGQEIADAVRNTGRINGPSFVIPNGIDHDQLRRYHKKRLDREIDLLIVGLKNPKTARLVASSCERHNIRSICLDRPVSRTELLRLMGNSLTMVCLPFEKEGFYLPGLEGMALETLVICPQFEGNKVLYQGGTNCLAPEYNPESIIEAINTSRNMPVFELNTILAEAAQSALKHELSRERTAFLEILNNVRQLWNNRAAFSNEFSK